MAHIANRSRFRVTVKNKPEATRYFSFNKLRYAHLCASRLASKLDECFKDETKVRVQKGRKLLNKHATVKVKDVVEASQAEHDHFAAPIATEAPTEPPAQAPLPALTSDSPQVSNVIPFRPRLRAWPSSQPSARE